MVVYTNISTWTGIAKGSHAAVLVRDFLSSVILELTKYFCGASIGKTQPNICRSVMYKGFAYSTLPVQFISIAQLSLWTLQWHQKMRTQGQCSCNTLLLVLNVTMPYRRPEELMSLNLYVIYLLSSLYWMTPFPVQWFTFPICREQFFRWKCVRFSFWNHPKKVCCSSFSDQWA